MGDRYVLQDGNNVYDRILVRYVGKSIHSAVDELNVLNRRLQEDFGRRDKLFERVKELEMERDALIQRDENHGPVYRVVLKYSDGTRQVCFGCEHLEFDAADEVATVLAKAILSETSNTRQIFMEDERNGFTVKVHAWRD